MTTSRPKALIIDDEKAIRRFVRTALTAEDFTVFEADTRQGGLRLAIETKPDIVVLDLGLPDGDGSSLIAPLLAQDNAPAILVLSAYDQESRKVAALDSGAHDFVTKPFGVEEFMARVRAALRHRLQSLGGAAAFENGRLKVDLVRHSVLVEGQDAKLTPREYDLLKELLTARGRVLTHKRLIECLWGKGVSVDVQTLRVHVRNLRQKVEINPEAPDLIHTEPGVGYRFQSD